jgi:hypothetical protein
MTGISIIPETVKFGPEFGWDQRYRNQFLNSFQQAVPDALELASGRCVVSSVSVALTYGDGSFGEFMVGLLSTVVPFVPLARSSRTGILGVNYSVDEGQGQVGHYLQSSVRGYYQGWFTTRFIGLSHLKRAQRDFAAENAARMIVDDLYAKYASSNSVPHRAGSPSPVPSSTVALSPLSSILGRGQKTVMAATNAPTCAVLTFDAQTGLTAGEVSLLSDRFTVEFGRLGKYRLLSRSKTSEILREQKFSRSETCSATDCAIEAGRLLSVRYMVYGSLGKLGNVYTANAYLVNVETGAAESTTTLDVRGNIEDLLTQGMEIMGRRLVGLLDRE